MNKKPRGFYRDEAGRTRPITRKNVGRALARGTVIRRVVYAEDPALPSHKDDPRIVVKQSESNIVMVEKEFYGVKDKRRKNAWSFEYIYDSEGDIIRTRATGMNLKIAIERYGVKKFEHWLRELKGGLKEGFVATRMSATLLDNGDWHIKEYDFEQFDFVLMKDGRGVRSAPIG